MKKPKTGGGWAAIRYTFRKASEAGGYWKFFRAMRSKNACKTCALGMGGQKGGMVNEAGHFPEVCKKSLQAMAADMQGGIRTDFWSTYSLPQLQKLSPRELESCGRLVEPVLYDGSSQYYRPITWDEAFERINTKLRATPADDTFWYFSGRSSNEAGFLLQLFARLYGTNNVNNCSYYCHQASGVGLTTATGSGTATIVLDDVERADLVFVIGGNPASNHPRLMRSLMQVRRNKGEVIVINPVLETGMVNFSIPSDVRSLLFGTEIASLYVQPHIGGDLALLTGMAKRIVELGATDEQYLKDHTTGWPELKARLAEVTWEEIETKSGVTRAEIGQIAERYAQAKRVIFSWTMGITHHAHGVENVQAIANLAFLRGMVGRPGSGLMPIRGHSNVQGIGSVGVTPKLKDAIFERLQNHFGVTLPTTPGLDTLGCMEQADLGRLKFGLCLGGNLFGSNPDAKFARQSLSKLDQLVYLNTTLNTGHAHGLARETIILPVLARDEEPQPTTQESMFNYVRLSDGGPRRHEGPKSEVEVIAALGQAILGEVETRKSEVGSQSWKSEVGNRKSEGNGESTAGNGYAGVKVESTQAVESGTRGSATESSSKVSSNSDSSVGGSAEKVAGSPIDWAAMVDTGRIRDAIAQIIPGFEQIGEIDKTKQEFQIPGRTICTPHFPTSDGRGRLHVHTLPSLKGGGTELRMMTVRSEGQFNTVVYEDYDYYRGVPDRDVICLHPEDIARLGLTADQRVTVRNETGILRGIRVHAYPDIRPGNALMYYPEANELVPRSVDPQSKTPAFKGVLVRVEG